MEETRMAETLDFGRLMERVSNLTEESRKQAVALKDMGDTLATKLDQQTNTLRERNELSTSALHDKLNGLTHAFVPRTDFIEFKTHVLEDLRGATASLRGEIAAIRHTAIETQRGLDAMKVQDQTQERDRAPGNNVRWNVLATVISGVLQAIILGAWVYFVSHPLSH